MDTATTCVRPRSPGSSPARAFALPDQSDSPALDDALDYQDVKLKIVQQEGYDEHDFNLFDDRASMLWRKPYVDGAVQELTAGDSRSEDQLRMAVEKMMLTAENAALSSSW